MISLQKIGDSAVKFVFTDSDHYLYGNGEIEVPVNSLLLVIDESEMVTFKKLSGDPFLSFRADNSNLGTKAAIEQFYKDNMVGSTGGGSGSGVTPSEVQEMIDESLDDYYDKDEVDTAFETVNTALSGKADASDVTAVANDVSTLSGQVATKVAITDFNAYSAATDSRLAEDEEVTAAALNDLDENKQDKLAYYEENTEDGYADIFITNDDGQGNVDEYTLNVGGGTVDFGHYSQYDDGQGNIGFTSTSIMLANPEINIYAESEENGETEATYFNITPLGATINNENVATEAYVDAALSGKVDTSAITSAITSGSTDDEIPTAKATYDAIQAGGGGGATYSAGYGINIDTANTISFNMPITCTTNTNSNITIGNGTNNGGWSMLIGNDIQNSGYGNIGLSVSDQSSGGGSITGARAILIGQHNSIYDSNPNYEGTSGIAIGSWNTSRNSGIVIGSNSTASGSSYVVIGNGATASGTTKMNLNNQIKVDTNNQVYIKDKTNTTDVCIQDAIAALGGLKLVKLTQNEYDNLATKDPDTLYIISNVVS